MSPAANRRVASTRRPRGPVTSREKGMAMTPARTRETRPISATRSLNTSSRARKAELAGADVQAPRHLSAVVEHGGVAGDVVLVHHEGLAHIVPSLFQDYVVDLLRNSSPHCPLALGGHHVGGEPASPRRKW